MYFEVSPFPLLTVHCCVFLSFHWFKEMLWGSFFWSSFSVPSFNVLFQSSFSYSLNAAVRLLMTAPSLGHILYVPVSVSFLVLLLLCLLLPQHFVCAVCERPFQGHPYYERRGHAYCERHFDMVRRGEATSCLAHSPLCFLFTQSVLLALTPLRQGAPCTPHKCSHNPLLCIYIVHTVHHVITSIIHCSSSVLPAYLMHPPIIHCSMSLSTIY